eukprot:gene23688-biopygen23847
MVRGIASDSGMVRESSGSLPVFLKCSSPRAVSPSAPHTVACAQSVEWWTRVKTGCLATHLCHRLLLAPDVEAASPTARAVGLTAHRAKRGRTLPRGGAAGAGRRLAGSGGAPGAGFGGTAGGGGQSSAVHGSNGRFDGVNGKIGPRRVGCTTKRTPSAAKVSAVFRDFPAACGRFELAGPLLFRVLEHFPRDLLLSRREASHRAGAFQARKRWMGSG